MSPNHYADGVLRTLEYIEKTIASLRLIVSKSPELTALYRVRNELQEKVKAFVGTLGMLQAMPNGGVGTWVIDMDSNKYYQFFKSDLFRNGIYVYMVRPDAEINVDVNSFNNSYRLATPSEVEQHEVFLNKKYGQISFVKTAQPITVPVNQIKNLKNIVNKPSIDPTQCEFYMVTCTGQRGAKVRHTRYDLAEKEALRVANEMNHAAWVVGVVAKIEPEVKTTYNVKKSW